MKVNLSVFIVLDINIYFTDIVGKTGLKVASRFPYRKRKFDLKIIT